MSSFPAPSMTHVALAMAGMLIFLALSMTSGRIAAGDGLGWDGRGYASLMTDGLDQGSVITRSRPLLPLVTRIPHAMGLDVIHSFQMMNAIYAFVLYLFVALILDAYGAGRSFTAIVVANLALSIATSKMYAFYPVQIDLGVLALMTSAFYFVMTDRHALAGLVCMLAMGSREFGVAVLLCGLHRTIRLRRVWPDAFWYLPAIAVAVAVRAMTSSDGTLSANDALTNLALALSPAFLAAFLYFTVTVFGGISMLLAVHPRWCVGRLREEPELATFLAAIAALTMVGNLDVWRYLVFALPVAVALIARFEHDRATSPALTRAVAAALTLVTIVTQRPFDRMDTDLYFRDWFPQYDFIRGTASPELFALWGIRLTALLFLVVTLASVSRSVRPLQESES